MLFNAFQDDSSQYLRRAKNVSILQNLNDNFFLHIPLDWMEAATPHRLQELYEKVTQNVV